MRALCLIRSAPVYRHQSFCRGLQAAGYELVARLDRPTPDDVLVIWNRYGSWDEQAKRFEAAGARVVVVENGYLGKDWLGGTWFSMALGHHAGAGRWVYGGSHRWDALGVDLGPMRTGGKEIVILGQRGIGEPGIASPDRWAEQTRAKVGGRIRPHPDVRGVAQVPLADDLRRASAVVTWASSAALRALLLGIPVYYEMPKWIGGTAACPLAKWPASAWQNSGDRLEMFRRLAWAQWRLTEIESGVAFGHLLGVLSVAEAA